MEIFLEIYGLLEEIKAFIINALPIEEFDRLVDEGVEESTIIDQIASLLRETLEASAIAEATLLVGVEKVIAQNLASEIFNNFIGHPEQNVKDRYQNKENWWWFDTLHYKRTGRFTQTLLLSNRARTLLLAGEADNYDFTNIYDAIMELAQNMIDT